MASPTTSSSTSTSTSDIPVEEVWKWTIWDTIITIVVCAIVFAVILFSCWTRLTTTARNLRKNGFSNCGRKLNCCSGCCYRGSSASSVTEMPIVSSISANSMDDYSSLHEDYPSEYASTACSDLTTRSSPILSNARTRQYPQPRQLVITSAVNNLAIGTNLLMEPLSPAVDSVDGLLELPPSYEESIIVTPESIDNTPFDYHYRTSAA